MSIVMYKLIVAEQENDIYNYLKVFTFLLLFRKKNKQKRSKRELVLADMTR